MGQGTPGVVEKPKEPRALEREVEQLRVRLDRSLAELDRRRHELADVKLQLRRHPEVLYAAGGVVLLFAAGIGFAIWRAQKKEEPVEKARRFRIAIGRAQEHPERVAQEPTVPQKILAAVGTTVAVAVTKKLLAKAWEGSTQHN